MQNYTLNSSLLTIVIEHIAMVNSTAFHRLEMCDRVGTYRTALPAVLMNKLAPCAYLSSGALEIQSLQLRLPTVSASKQYLKITWSLQCNSCALLRNEGNLHHTNLILANSKCSSAI